MNIGDTISRAIKEGKWLSISYVNKNNENTYYWIAIHDIDIKAKRFLVAMFNDKISLDTLNDKWIFFENIKEARIIDFSSYDIPNSLLDKIEKNIDKCSWLNYDHFNHSILNYYCECNLLDSDPCQKEYQLVSGIDVSKLLENKFFKLNDEQTKKIIEDIYKYDLKKVSLSYYSLAINVLSISEGKNKFLICYYIVTFDPSKKMLVLDKTLRFNHSFLIEGRRHSLFRYLNMDVDEFCKGFLQNKSEYKETITANLRSGETIDDRPDIMLLQRDILLDLSSTYDEIEDKYNTGELNVPLKSFFGNITKKNNAKKKEPSLIIYDRRININQMRVLYNALKYPVTYVQGPPGTGKTQTILNVVLSAFYNDKTTLVCSSNNKPVDGIIEKLRFTYKDEIINFPFLRLGNFDDVKNATIKILELYKYQTQKEADDTKLEKIKTSNDEVNEKLIELLNKQEKRVEIENYIDSSKKLLQVFTKQNKFYSATKDKLEQLTELIRDFPEVGNEEITSLFNPLCENYKLSQFLYFKSLQFISKLKKPRFSDLIEICKIEDEDKRATEFNIWLQNDNNMKKLNEVFPVIFSTNISSRRLGSSKYNFDLVIMDEAGQCNIATALVPINKAKSLLLVGDPNQLKPVIVLEDEVNDLLMKKYNWLKKYSSIIEKCETTILDLGCGVGNDTLYFTEKGYNVISCDYSKVALDKLKQEIPNAKTMLIDISKKLPFEDNLFDLIIADLSLHYFDDKTTKSIMLEIKRILKNGGYLLARVNSINDINYGAGQGEKLEEKFYFVGGYNKRFFDIEDVNKYFSLIGKVNSSENDMIRYTKPKKIIEIFVKKQNKQI